MGPEWGITWFSSLYSNTSDITFDCWSKLEEKILKPATTYVSHDVFVGMKKTDGKKYGSIKGKNGVIMGGISPMVDGKYSCASGTPPIEKFCIIAMDYDDGIPSNFEDVFREALGEYSYIAYTTVSSVPERKRWRIIVPLEKAVNAEVRTAIMRTMVEKIGWAGFDKSGLRPSQRMALPVKLSDQEVQFIRNEGKFLNETVLPEGWDVIELPKSPEEREENHRIRHSVKSSFVPIKFQKKDRGGIIGKFDAVYTCGDILERSGKYRKRSETENEQRWSRIGDDAGGVVVYNSGICKCFYASDVLGGRPAMDAFGLYVILFYNDDFKEAYKAAKADKKVRDELIKDLIGLKPADSGDWGDGESYSGGWRGILERLNEFKKYKYMVVNDKKATGYWYVFDGQRYVPTNADQIGDDIFTVLKITCAINPDLSEVYSDYITNNQKCINLVKSFSGLPGMKVNSKFWDADDWILNCKDKIIDLRKFVELKGNGGDLRECLLDHSGDKYITLMTDISAEEVISPKEEPSKFLNEFLMEVMPDREALDYMMMAIGSSLVDCSADNKIVFFLGESSRNGKSSLMYCLKGALGDYYGTADAENFKMGAKDPSRPNPQLDRLRHVKIATFNETQQHIVLDISYLKQFWGSENTTRTLNEAGGAWKMKARGLFDLNSMPRLSDPGDVAFKARLRIIPWKISFLGRENPAVQKRLADDKSVQAALTKELLDGLYYWTKNGCMLDRGNDIPPSVKAEIDDFYLDIDDIGGYIDGYIDVTNDASDFVSTDDILADFAKSGGADIRKNSFSKQFKRRMLELAKTNVNIKEGRAYLLDGTRPRGWYGIRLRRLSDDELVQKANENGGHYTKWEANSLRNVVDKSKLEKVIRPIAAGETITQAEIDKLAENDEIPF